MRNQNSNITCSYNIDLTTGCPNKKGNSVTNSISSLLLISIVIPNFKNHNIIMSARVYFIIAVNGCKDDDVSILSTTVCSQNINKQNVNIADEILTYYSFSVGITILN